MTQQLPESETSWQQYYRVVAGRPPREFLRHTLRRFEAPGTAIDLGCGAGSDTHFMLSQGWHVLAIDREEAAIELVSSTAPPDAADRLSTQVASFESVELPRVDLIWAGLSLPFCPPDQFESLWRRIEESLVKGGRFAGDFFGPRHAWFGEDKMAFHSKEEILHLCRNLKLEYIVEGEGEQQTALDGMQHLHIFTICVRKA